jgi:hypothetical protein
MGVVLAAALLATVQISERREDGTIPRFRPRWLALHALAVVMALGLAAVAVLPAKAAMAGSPRSTPLSRGEAEIASFHPLRVLELAAPNCMGDVYSDYPAAPIVGEPALDGLPFSYSAYLGASVLALALAAFRRRFLFVALGVLSGCALLVAFGRHTPVHAVLRRLVPPLAYMRSPEKYLTLVVVAMALLAGLGTRRILSGGPQPWRRTVVFLLVLVGIGAASPFLFPYPWSGFMVQGFRHGAVVALAVLGVQVLASRGSRLASPVLVIVVALDLAVAALSLQGFVGREVAASVPMAVRLVKDDHAGHVEPPRTYRMNAVDRAMARRSGARNPVEGELRLLATLIPNTVNIWGLATLPGYDAAIPTQMNRLWDGGRGRRLTMLRLLGTDYAVLPADGTRETTGRAGLEFLGEAAPGAQLYRVTGSLPQVFLAGRAEVLADGQAATRLLDPAVVAGDEAVLAPPAQPLAGAPGRAGSCELSAYASRRVEARCQASRPALAVFLEQHDPGWHATVDGRPVPVLRANLAMRAVALPPGEHRIVLEYQAAGLRPGAFITLLALACLIALAIVSRRAAPSPSGP